MSSETNDSTPGPIRTLNDLVFHLREASTVRPDLLTVSRGDRREALSATDFLRSVHSLALALESRGLRAGERVAVLSENRPEWHVVDFACQLLGAPTVPVFPRAGKSHVAFILRNSGSRFIFYSDSDKRDLLHSLEGDLTQMPERAAFDGEAAGPESTSVTRLMGEGARRMAEVPLERFRGRVDADDLASILYTSGTTGEPKGVMLSHGNLVSNLLACSRVFDLGPSDRAISFLPLSHVFQRTVDHLCFYRGVCIHYVPRVDDLDRALRRERPTVLAATPEIYESFRAQELERTKSLPPWRRRLFRWAVRVGKRHGRASREGLVGPVLALQSRLARHFVLRSFRERLGGALRFAISGGAPLAEEVVELFEAAGLPLYQGYGLTETSPVLATNSPEFQRIGSVGKPLSDVDLRIAEDGEILVRGPGVMQGYWQNPEATAKSMDDSGWFRTGDLGRMDKSGYVFITDRKRDVLVLSTGENVAPRPIEALLSGAPLGRAVVVGDGRPFPSVLFAPSDDATEGSAGAPADLDGEARERVERVNLQLPEPVRIRKWAFLPRPLSLEEGELTPTHKLRRKQIRQSFAAEIARLYEERRPDP